MVVLWRCTRGRAWLLPCCVWLLLLSQLALSGECFLLHRVSRRSSFRSRLLDSVADRLDKETAEAVEVREEAAVSPYRRVERGGVELYPLIPEVGEGSTDAAPKLPAGEFKPKQSLGQNYLADQNFIKRICRQFHNDSEGGEKVIELGPGAGALTKVLFQRFPKMTVVELDPRSIALLGKSMPSLDIIHDDVLQIDWLQLAKAKGGRVSVVGNLPYYITSQILFCLIDAWRVIDQAVVTTQWEVAERIVAKPGDKQYSILSVVFQLYSRPKLLFKIPPTVFYPKPKVDSALLHISFPEDRPSFGVSALRLKEVVHSAFRQRRKTLRQSLKAVYQSAGLKELPGDWGGLRAQQVSPEGFVELTKAIFGEAEEGRVTRVWRKAKHGDY
uniref:rRNA adenine N(6)-methyltransferase n=1 Tax=Chromera velia CCMP2878 TaxID=1169474 RepID=A0A0G4HZN6_9ALVE|eukprot:Cvel_9746.t1-p1 / transcript=Cvel_9746.t1 / gene=Cvel_9746 / organism=Chromera_velia_CCMP2878 / gene_product=Ribosomal RNA small subunit methyltransferase A, putative / transcript_product=Ribosomal RNA small subunit methyltransferase A, putative / location=Cvel_scaffold570:8963-14676(+) / protein_length=385 / sequence_SO=supercontig / SO=protein_coding / is_pseudo=false